MCRDEPEYYLFNGGGFLSCLCFFFSFFFCCTVYTRVETRSHCRHLFFKFIVVEYKSCVCDVVSRVLGIWYTRMWCTTMFCPSTDCILLLLFYIFLFLLLLMILSCRLELGSQCSQTTRVHRNPSVKLRLVFATL